jgi:hypothetical protein
MRLIMPMCFNFKKYFFMLIILIGFGCNSTTYNEFKKSLKSQHIRIVDDTFIKYLYKTISVDGGMKNFFLCPLEIEHPEDSVLIITANVNWPTFNAFQTGYLLDSSSKNIYRFQNGEIFTSESMKIPTNLYGFNKHAIKINKNKIGLIGANYKNDRCLDMRLIVVDSIGKEVNKKTFGKRWFDYGTSIVASEGEGLFAIGATYQNPFCGLTGTLMKMDFEGNIIRTTKYEIGSNLLLNGIVNDKKKGFIAVGQTWKDFNSSICILWINNNGDILKKIERPGQSANCVCKTKMGKILVAGTLSNGYLLFCLNEEGEELWKHEENVGEVSSFRSVLESKSGEIYVVGFKNDSDKKDGIFKNEELYISHFNSSGILISEKTYGGNDADEAYCIVPYGDHNMLVGGYTYSSNKQKCLGWLLEVNESLDTVSTRYIERTSNAMIYTVLPLPEQKKILIGGEFWDSDAGYEIIGDEGFLYE